jgi:thiosulfate/3-mercaptopyruvate sulfurtransferase
MCAAIFAAGNGESSIPDILVETEYVENIINQENLVILDTGRKDTDFAAGHLPTAVEFPRDLYYQKVNGIPGMFPGPDSVSASLEKAGISNNTRVIIYDAGNSLWATRLFWTLEYLGHKNVAVLNGGYAKWQAEGRSISTEITSYPNGDFQYDVQDNLLITGTALHQDLDSVTVIDARSPGEYAGTDVRADRGGHIPEAINIDWVYNNTGEEINTFLTREELKEFYDRELSAIGDEKIVTHCQTGVRGAHTYFVLRLLGYKDVSLYDGSWIEWANDETFPVTQSKDS